MSKNAVDMVYVHWRKRNTTSSPCLTTSPLLKFRQQRNLVTRAVLVVTSSKDSVGVPLVLNSVNGWGQNGGDSVRSSQYHVPQGFRWTPCW